jgi:UV DNA damage endonuclease
MRLGYACVNTQLPSAARTARLSNLTGERIVTLIDANLDALESILRWNVTHGIQVFRLSSNVVPFGSHPANDVPWWDVFGPRLTELGRLVRAADMRLSTHPGQYIVLSSAREDVVVAALAELEYHDRLLGALGLDGSHKIVIHPGSGAADPESARARFAAGYRRLSSGAAARLALENDERWPLDTTLAWARDLGIPVVFDEFHHGLAPSFDELSVREVVELAGETWRGEDGRPEVHFSTQAAGKRPGAHAETIDLDAFAEFVAAVGDLPLDCILEVKDKERSVLRAQPLLSELPPEPQGAAKGPTRTVGGDR